MSPFAPKATFQLRGTGRPRQPVVQGVEVAGREALDEPAHPLGVVEAAGRHPVADGTGGLAVHGREPPSAVGRAAGVLDLGVELVQNRIYLSSGNRCHGRLPSDPTTAADPGGFRILACRRAPACTFGLVALSAAVVALLPGPATAAAPGPATVRFEPLAAGASGLTVAGTGSFRGAIEVRRNGRGLAVVNDLALEEYVRGIDEVPPSWPAAALQAQAIAARTYAANTALTGDARWRAVGADICATPTCQVYRGLDTERKAQGHGWLPAVEATAGRALLEGGRPIRASYSSTANGPRAMSQNGALAMANEGRSANEILSAYYGVPPTLAPAKLPATIKVAVKMSTTTVRLTAGSPFRVVDGAGTPLATGGAGEWAVVAGGDGVRLVPPATYTGEPAPAPAPALPDTGVPPPLRGPGRAMVAATPAPAGGRWPVAVALLALGAATSTITLNRRRRA